MYNYLETTVKISQVRQKSQTLPFITRIRCTPYKGRGLSRNYRCVGRKTSYFLTVVITTVTVCLFVLNGIRKGSKGKVVFILKSFFYFILDSSEIYGTRNKTKNFTNRKELVSLSS